MTAPRILAADIGRTTCRVAAPTVVEAGVPFDADQPRVEVPSGAGLADPGGVAIVLDALADATASLPDAQAGSRTIAVVAVGVAGAGQQPAASAQLLDALSARYPAATVRVTSDVVTAHLGALEGRPGALVIAGTGAVALAVAANGSHRLVDGCGPLLGDAGSGASIGRAGLGAALRHLDGRVGGSAALAAAARERYGPLDRLVATIQGDPAAVRTIAAFVPDVAAAARAGEPIAADILRRAVDELAVTTGAALAHLHEHGDRSDAPEVAITGGLTALDDLVLAPLVRAVTTHHPGVRFLPPARDGLSGSLRLATQRAGAHDPLVLQAPRTREVRAPREEAASGTSRSEES